MLIKIPALLGLILSLSTTSIFANEESENINWLKTNVAVAHKHIIPRYRSLATSTNKLKLSVEKLCRAKEPVKLNKKVNRRFKSAYIDWAGIQHVRFGPVNFLKRLERLQYWPDKHNSSERQVRKLLLAIEEEKELALTNFERKSVAVQGFTTLERVLFSKDGVLSLAECKLAIAVSENISNIADELDNNWRLSPVEFAKEFELAGREAGTYGSSNEVVAILANAFTTQLLIISEYKLGRALPKKSGGRTFARQLEAWRSELSLDLAYASLKSLRALYKTAFKEQLKTKNKAMDKRIEENFSHALSLFKRPPSPMISLIDEDAGIAQIKELKRQVESLESLIRQEMFSELGFATRFNSLDGD